MGSDEFLEILKKRLEDTGRKLAEQKRIVAYHEAGHGVIAHGKGVVLRELTIDPDIARADGIDTTAEGQMSIKRLGEKLLREASGKPPRERWPATCKAIISILLSGPAAEYIYNGEQRSLDDRGLKDFRSTGDYSRAESIVKGLIDWGLEVDDPEQFLRAIFDEVVITLKSKWSGVEALAKVLLKEVTISEEELQEFFESENGNERMTY